MAKLHFFGGTRSVTGANYLLDTGTLKILIDCGLHQGSRFSEEYNYKAFEYDPGSIDYLIITHSHADHMGRVPKLIRDGFKGTILATEPTRAIIEVALPDTLEKIKEEARETGHEPLYKDEHINHAMRLFRGVKYNEPMVLDGRVTVKFHDASHVLGSAIVEIVIEEDSGEEKRIVFSGDLGNPPGPLLNPIDYVSDADYVVIESAYGDRFHEDAVQRQDILERTIAETIVEGGTLIIPSFAIERTQEILLELDGLFVDQKIPRIPVFLDSPLATSITRAYERFPDYFSPAATDSLRASGGLFRFPWLTFTTSTHQSKNINDVPAPKIIIAGSGMSQGGRILHHEMRYLPGPKNTILFVGYQVKGCLGRRIRDGEKSVRIMGQEVPVRCRIRAIGAYSAHADQDGLIKFVAEAKKGGELRKVFVVQGEEQSALALSRAITEKLSVPAEAPETAQVFDL